MINYAESRPSRFVWIGPLKSDINLDKLKEILESYGRMHDVSFLPGISIQRHCQSHYYCCHTKYLHAVHSSNTASTKKQIFW